MLLFNLYNSSYLAPSPETSLSFRRATDCSQSGKMYKNTMQLGMPPKNIAFYANSSNVKMDWRISAL